ncbi:uronyl 2-sulfotransferase-like [Glandiceps talaboti]
MCKYLPIIATMVRIQGHYFSTKLILTVVMVTILLTYILNSLDIQLSLMQYRSTGDIGSANTYRVESKTERDSHLRQTLLDASKGLPLDLATTGNMSRLVFNRVGKCGSRSLVHTIDLLSKRLKFPHIKSKVFDKKRLKDHEKAEFAFEVDSYDPPFIYNRHLNFIDFGQFGAEEPHWINLIRDPLNRTISFYYYTRFGDGISSRPVDNVQNPDQTFDDCVLLDKTECNATTIFAIIPYFCGQDPRCDVPTRWALETAKENVINHYIVIGVLEDFNSTLSVLEGVLPQFFKGATDAYRETREKGLVESYKSIQRKEPSDEVKRIMRERLSLEYEFYFFIRRRFELIKQQLINEGVISNP